MHTIKKNVFQYIGAKGDCMQVVREIDNLGRNIAAARRRLGLTQDQVAAQLQVRGCDMSRSVYAKIEVGIRHVSLAELRVLKEVLKVSYDELLDGKN